MSDTINGVEGSILKVCNDDGCEEKHMPAEFYAVSHPENYFSLWKFVCLCFMLGNLENVKVGV